MMRSIIRASMQYRFLVIVLAGALIVAGINQLRKMPVDVLPEFSPPYVEIQTEALGLSAKEIEQMITVPMEQDLLAGVAWLDVIRSQSVPGLSSVVVFFEPGTDLYRARQMVAAGQASEVSVRALSRPWAAWLLPRWEPPCWPGSTKTSGRLVRWLRRSPAPFWGSY